MFVCFLLLLTFLHVKINCLKSPESVSNGVVQIEKVKFQMFHGLQPIECILIIFLVLLFNRDECDNVESRILVISKSAFFPPHVDV